MVEIAQSAVDPSSELSLSVDAISLVSTEVSKLDNEVLEDLRYHALGLIICRLAEVLQDPEVRQAIIEHSAYNMLTAWDAWGSGSGPHSSKGLLVSDVEVDPLGTRLTDIAKRASDGLPRGVQLLADVLQVESKNRENDLTAQKRIKRTDDILAGKPAAEAVSKSAFVGASAVLQVALEVTYEHRPPENLGDSDEQRSEEADGDAAKMAAPEKKESSPAVADVLDEEGIRSLRLYIMANRLAVLRRDEFLKDMRKYIDVDDNGELIFRRDRMVRSSELPEPEVHMIDKQASIVIHRKRLRCPAVFIEGLIPLMIDMVTEIVILAQKIVDQETKSRFAPHGPLPVTVSKYDDYTSGDYASFAY